MLPAGNVTVEVDCTETDGDIDWPLITLSAALVDDDGTPESVQRAAPVGALDTTGPAKRRR